MFKFLIIVVGLIFLSGFLFGFSVLRMFFRAILGIQQPQPRKSSSNQQKTKQATNKSSTPSPTKKIILRDEGEYVDYEEIKD